MITFMTKFMVALSVVLALIPHVLWLLGRTVGLCFHYRLPYAPFGWVAAGLVVLAWAVLSYGIFFGRWQQETVAVDYSHADVPEAFDGYRIVHISDLHLGTFDDKPEQLQRIVDSINALHPDLICFTGDLVSLSVEEARSYTPVLQRLKARDGVASTLGNHDFFIYSFRDQPMRREQEVDSLVKYEHQTLGWHLLRNQHWVLHRGQDSLTVVGVDNIHGSGQGFSTVDRGDLGKAVQGTGGFRILLSHDPSHWEAEVLKKTDIALTLSGHTHAAQFRILGWTPASWMFRQAAGRYDNDGQTIYVNAGIGCTMPMRINCPSEITLITLHKK
jgi:predicted MPP superfamily phosphohydrolase